MDPDELARRLAAESRARNDPTGWFERLYAAARDGEAVVPWDRTEPQHMLEQWGHGRDGHGRRALVVGCGLGRDAEFVARLGFDTLAFDVSPTAVESARRRHAGSPVRYVRADLLDLPTEWLGAFDLVVESLTVQSLPDPPRREAIAQIGRPVARGGTLLVFTAAREEDEAVEGPPWPLTRAEIDAFAADRLRPVRVDEVRDADGHRWRAEFSRPRLALAPWAGDGLQLLRRANTPEMTEHLGGPETEQKLRRRHERYLRDGEMYRIVEDVTPVGIIGYWARTWNGEDVFETGWHVLPEYQGRGIATAAIALVAAKARAERTRRYLHAFPSVANAPSNAICRKAGFDLLGECDFEYPPGHSMRCNDWRLDLTAGR